MIEKSSQAFVVRGIGLISSIDDIKNIVIKNVKGVEKGVKKMTINNTEIKGDFIPLDMMKAKNKVIVEMG